MEMMYLQYFLMGLIVFLEILHWRERKSLYDRLMARDLNEYSLHELENKRVKIKEPKREQFIPL